MVTLRKYDSNTATYACVCLTQIIIYRNKNEKERKIDTERQFKVPFAIKKIKIFL